MKIRIQNYTEQNMIDGMRHLLKLAEESDLVRQHALKITNGHENKIAAIYDWVVENVKYVPDPDDIELFTSPERLLKNLYSNLPVEEDCDGHAMLTTALLNAIGIEAHVIIVDVGGEGLDHALTMVWSDKLSNHIYIDTASDTPLGWQLRFNRIIIV